MFLPQQLLAQMQAGVTAEGIAYAALSVETISVASVEDDDSKRVFRPMAPESRVATVLVPERGLEMLTAGQWRQKLGLVDFRGKPVFWREVATKQIEQRVVQAWNSRAWAAEADSIEELIFYTDGAAQLTEAWPRRVASAGWGAIVSQVSLGGTHRRLLGAACAPCMMDGQFSTSAPSAPAAELTAAAAVGLLLDEENSGAWVRACPLDSGTRHMP